MIIRGLLGILFLTAPSLAAQAPTRAAGVVLRPSGSDAVPVPNVRVVLHRVGRATQGPFDSVITGKDGRFAFSFVPDSTASYLLSTRYASIAYFSPPLPIKAGRSDPAIKLLVFDTSSTARLTTKSRTLVVSSPDALGARTVVDWFVVTNAGNTTRVGRDSLDPTWLALLPAGVRNAQVGDARVNQVSSEAVTFRGDTALVFAPLSPGDKELLFRYELAPAATRLAVLAPDADSMDIFLEEPNATVGPDQWAVTAQTFEGRQFRRFSHRTKLSGPVAIRFPGLGIAPATLLPLLVAAFGIVLALFSWRLIRPPAVARAGGSPSSARSRDALAAMVAELDRRFQGQEADLPAADWESYRAERARLIAELEAALARGSRGA